MSTAPNLEPVSVEDYLAAELASPIKHEYLDGAVYPKSGGRNRHNQIATNALIALGNQLRGQPCRAFNSDKKIRIRLPNHLRFYYPDLSVVCRPNPQEDVFQDEPVIILEVLSSSTRRLDQGEKQDAYLSIPSLAVYLTVEQESARVQALRRTEQGFVREVYQGLDTLIPLPEIATTLPPAETR